MKFIVLTLVAMTKYKKTLAYLVVVLGLILLANATSANAASKGSTSFRVGSERVDRTTKYVNSDDDYIRIHVYVDGDEIDLIETRNDGCLAYFYRSGVSVRLNTCKADEHMAVRAVNASDATKRVTVKWEVVMSSDDTRRRG